MKKTYKSAVDLWLAALLIGLPLALAGFGAVVTYLGLHFNFGPYFGVVFIGLGVGLGVLFAAVSLPCQYTLSDTELRIQAGVLEWIVPYSKILRLELSCSLWSAPALSLQRVKIVLDDGFRLVSPRNRAEFIEELNSHLKN